jgi:lysozyme family protein
MAQFLLSYQNWVKPNEGGYGNVPADKGGETYAGLARKYNPELVDIWKYIDDKKRLGPIPRGTIFPDLNLKVQNAYRNLYTKNLFDKINNQSVADILFDWFVNSGNASVSTTAKETYGIDEILNDKFHKNIPRDGKYDPTTINAINSTNPVDLYNEVKNQRLQFYKAILAKDPTQKIFKDGWFNRINRFPTLTKTIPLIALIAVGVGLYLLTKNN